MIVNIELRGKIEAKFEETEKMLNTLPGGAIQAGCRALNRAALTGRVAAIKKAKERYYINSTNLRNGMKLKKATKSMLLAKITSKSTRRELIDFNVSPKEVIRGNKISQLKISVKRGGSAKVIPRTFVEKGTQSGRVHVLQRMGKERYPIHIKYGPSPTEMLSSADVIPYVEEQAGMTLLKRLDHEIDYLLGK